MTDYSDTCDHCGGTHPTEASAEACARVHQYPVDDWQDH